jgi:diacylglycerol kinase (ATP)
MSFRSRSNSVQHALRGIGQLYKQEPNARIHAVATVAVITGGIIKHLTPMQWAAIAAAIAMVWITEAINTAIEQLCNLYCKGEWHPAVKIIKDISAGAVLIAAITSIAIAICIFIC